MNNVFTSNIREVIKFYNPGDKTFETDFSIMRMRTIIGSKFQIDPITITLFLGAGQKAPPRPQPHPPVAGEISKSRI